MIDANNSSYFLRLITRQKSTSISVKMSLSNSNTYLSIPSYWKAKLIIIDFFLTVSVFHEFTLMRRNANITRWCLIFWDRVWKICSTSAVARESGLCDGFEPRHETPYCLGQHRSCPKSTFNWHGPFCQHQ